MLQGFGDWGLGWRACELEFGGFGLGASDLGFSGSVEDLILGKRI